MATPQPPRPQTPATVSALPLSTTLLGILLGVLLFDLLARSQEAFAAEDVGLGMGTVPHTAEREGRQISGPFEDLPALLESFRALKAEGRTVVLWLGASQLYGINQPERGDRVAGWYASERAAARGSDLAYVVCANPNANPNELYAALLAFLQQDLVPDALVVGVTFDDLREPGIRALALAHLRTPEPPELASDGAAAEHVAIALARAAVEPESSAPVERSPTDGTPQAWLEDRLVAALEGAWPAYALRGSLRSAAISAWKVPVTAAIYRLFRRPTVRITPERQAWNEAGLEGLVRAAARRDIPLFVYKCPYRPDPATFFHERAAYDAFHSALERRLRDDGAHYLDLETLVPVELWGQTSDGSPDVYHFRARGHRLLGEALDRWLEESGF